jgi:tRNA nucleotidyltransferase (CCA-adding enzyme)
MTITLYEVGGHVRDNLLGIESNDIDYSVEAPSWEAMRAWVHDTHTTVFVEKPEFLTIRAKHPDGDVRDYVMCRKDSAYGDQRHPDKVEPGTLADDLARRDFTINAMARTMDGTIIDPHDGQHDLVNKTLRCVGNAKDRILEDPLRLIRAIRFSATLDLEPTDDLLNLIMSFNQEVFTGLQAVSTDRIRGELDKGFRKDTFKMIKELYWLNPRYAAFFFQHIWLMPTTRDK